MDKNQFIQLSEQNVRQLNGSNKEEAFQAWRAGYIYAQQIVYNSITNDFNTEFIDKMEEFATEELEVFKFNL